jgi:hypothetical protein
MAISANEVLQFPFYHGAAVNGTKEMRQVHAPHDYSDLSLDSFGTLLTSSPDGADWIYMSVAGVPAGVTYATVYITGSIDYMPGTSSIGLVKPRNTPDYPATIQCYASLVKRHPYILQLTLDEAKDLAAVIMELPPDADSIRLAVDAYFRSNKISRPRLSSDMVSSGGGDSSMMEIEF